MKATQDWPVESPRGSVRVLAAEQAMNYRDKLKEFLQKKSLLKGNFTLSSGRVSSYYLDCKLTTLDPKGAFLTGHAVLECLDSMGIHADAIGGLTMGADPIVSATAVVSHVENRDLQAFLIRKERKQHGREKQIEGIEGSVHKVVIVDEVCTTGKSTQEAIDAAVDSGLEVVAVLSLVDREEGGSERLRRCYKYKAIFTARELLGENLSSSPASAPRSGNG